MGEKDFKHIQYTEDEWVEDIMLHLQSGKACRLVLDKPVATLYIIPSPLWQLPDDAGGMGILIVQEGKGSFLWDGAKSLNPFVLVQSGMHLSAARMCASLVNTALSRLRHASQALAQE